MIEMWCNAMQWNILESRNEAQTFHQIFMKYSNFCLLNIEYVSMQNSTAIDCTVVTCFWNENRNFIGFFSCFHNNRLIGIVGFSIFSIQFAMLSFRNNFHALARSSLYCYAVQHTRFSIETIKMIGINSILLASCKANMENSDYTTGSKVSLKHFLGQQTTESSTDEVFRIQI